VIEQYTEFDGWGFPDIVPKDQLGEIMNDSSLSIHLQMLLPEAPSQVLNHLPPALRILHPFVAAFPVLELGNFDFSSTLSFNTARQESEHGIVPILILGGTAVR
jgi:hypothetical protein